MKKEIYIFEVTQTIHELMFCHVKIVVGVNSYVQPAQLSYSQICWQAFAVQPLMGYKSFANFFTLQFAELRLKKTCSSTSGCRSISKRIRKTA